MEHFQTAPQYPGDSVAIEREGFRLVATMEFDGDTGAPWLEHDGHGEVTGWTTRAKLPGELILNSDRGSKRYYDFAGACRIARRDGWGPRPYRINSECNANGIWTVSAQWFEGRDLLSFEAKADDQNLAYRSVYQQLKESIGARRYAALAARSDFERMQAWSDDEWHWCGIVVTAYRNGIELGSASLWGIESDSGEYLVDVANELMGEAIDDARSQVAALCECEGEA